jgi:hypothetical protein
MLPESKTEGAINYLAKRYGHFEPGMQLHQILVMKLSRVSFSIRKHLNEKKSFINSLKEKRLASPFSLYRLFPSLFKIRPLPALSTQRYSLPF